MIRKISGFDKFNGLKAKALISARYKNLPFTRQTFSKNTAPASQPPPPNPWQATAAAVYSIF